MGGTVLYIDPWSGVAGDMLLAALLDAARDHPSVSALLAEAVDSLRLRGVVVNVSRGSEWGLSCTKVKVREEEAPPLRGFDDLAAVIAGSGLADSLKQRATAALRTLVEVEASVHGVALEDVHLHEVGAADTLVDVVGTLVLVDALGVQRVYVGEIPVGGGTVRLAHGQVGVPAPATVRLLEGYRVRGGPEPKELTTPTGALLVRALGAIQGPLPTLTIRHVGYGAGELRLESGPNVLRVIVGEESGPAGYSVQVPGAQTECVVELVTNLDDVTPEVVGYAVGRLRGSGALDVWTSSADFKKDRPGCILHVLVSEERVAEAAAIIFEETGSLGLRSHMWTRHVLERGWEPVEVGGFQVRVKWGRLGERIVSLAPEYDDAARVADQRKIPLRDVAELALRAARLKLGLDKEVEEGSDDRGR